MVNCRVFCVFLQVRCRISKETCSPVLTMREESSRRLSSTMRNKRSPSAVDIVTEKNELIQRCRAYFAYLRQVPYRVRKRVRVRRGRTSSAAAKVSSPSAAHQQQQQQPKQGSKQGHTSSWSHQAPGRSYPGLTQVLPRSYPWSHCTATAPLPACQQLMAAHGAIISRNSQHCSFTTRGIAPPSCGLLQTNNSVQAPLHHAVISSKCGC